MASRTIRGRQRSIAVARVIRASERLADALGVDAPVIPTSHKDAEYLPTVQLDAVAEFMERIVGPEPTVIAEGAETELGVEVDSDGVPVVVTEPPQPNYEEMNRPQLNAYATELGIEAPGSLPNKPAVIEAIRQVEAATAPTADLPNETPEETTDVNDPRVPTTPTPETPVEGGDAETTDDGTHAESAD